MSKPIPSVFCWTKMGSEAGQSLEQILARKELERSVGKGTFCWGIGSSLGHAPKVAAGEATDGVVEVIFTKMKSAAKAIDESPASLLLWTSYYSESGKIVDLPSHMIVTSRGTNPSGHPKKVHYALMCQSKYSLGTRKKYEVIDGAQTKNFISQNQVGPSQVTALVSYENSPGSLEKPYEVAFHAQFHGAGFIKLAYPVAIQGKVEAVYKDLCQANNEQEWRELTRKLINITRKRSSRSWPTQQLCFIDSANTRP